MLFQASLYIALVVCGCGLLYKISTWFRYHLDNDRQHTLSRRVGAFVKGCLATLFSRRLITLLKVLVLDVLLQVRIWRENRIRWIMHICLMYGFMALLLLHALEKYISENLFANYYPTLSPYLLIRNLAFVSVMVGLIVAICRRTIKPSPRFMTNRADRFILIVIAVVMLSGFFLEGSNILSYTRYQEMVSDYAALDDPDDEKALACYWAANFGVIIPDLTEPVDTATLDSGAQLHEDYCAECHSRPQWAFASYGLSRLIKPLSAALDPAGLPTLLWHVHYLACFIGLALFPFSKLFHIVTTPLSLMINAVMDTKTSDQANIQTRQIMELDACTHCGACTQQCAVGVIFNTIANASILPSEKIALTKRLTSGRDMDSAQVKSMQSGFYLCTNCHRCTDVCPAGINLQQIWFKTRETIFQKGYPDAALLSPLSYYRGLMAPHISRENYNKPLQSIKQCVASIFEFAHQEDDLDPQQMDEDFRSILRVSAQSASFSTCFTCSTCTSVCPVVKCFEDPNAALDMMPHQMMHAVAMGLRDMVFSSRMLWACLGCYQCQEACPQQVHVTDVLSEIKSLASHHINQRAKAA